MAPTVETTEAKLKEIVSWCPFCSLQRTVFQTLEEFLFRKYTLPSVGKEAHFHSADKTGIKINCSTLLNKISGKW